MINKRVRQIHVEEKKTQEQREAESTHKFFHHSKKATKLMLSESELTELALAVQDKNKCVIL